MYTTASGVQIPQGTDSFSPTTQFKNWADKAATYENRVVVATDSERNALTTPVRRDGLECYVTGTGVLWVYDAGWHVIGGVRRQQLDTANSTAWLTQQFGMGKITGNNTASINKAVTFPAAFSSVPFMQVTYIGFRNTGAFNVSGLSFSGSVVAAMAGTPTLTGFTAAFQLAGSTLSSTADFYYSWCATGVLA